jgi:two-component system, OmpR family, alkaline phosphatase synthesis response regulator PhoP
MKVIYSLEDDVDISKIIHVSMEKVGYEIHSFETGKAFMEAFESKKPDLCLLDLMLPDVSGMDILKKIRCDSSNDKIQIIIISAKRMTMDKVEGLDNGADDYIEKPFDILELISRVNARFRKSKNILTFQDIILDPATHSAKRNNVDLSLTNMEYDILKLFLENISNVITRDDISKAIYQSDTEIESRSIDMHVASLRKKLKDKEGHLIKTIYGVGYILG